MFGMFKKIPALILGAGLICSSVQNEDFGYLWLGALDDADKQPVLWRVLAVGGNGATYTNDAGEPCEKPLFLLTDDLLGLHPLSGAIQPNEQIKFYLDEAANQQPATPAAVWQNSDARKWCRHFAEACFTEPEREAVLATSKSDDEYHAKRDFNNPELPPVPAAAEILRDDKLFFLSDEEAENPAYGFHDKKRYAEEQEWWTRSYEGFFEPLGCIEVGIVQTEFGGLLRAPAGPNIAMGARPALNLNRERILFTSIGVTGKVRRLPSGPAHLALVEKLPLQKLEPWKLTLLDTERDKFAVGTVRLMEQVLTIPYRNAIIYHPLNAPNERISAIVTDKTGTDIKYYGNIALPLHARGEAQLDMTAIDWAIDDRLFVFSEQCNGYRRTDFASPLQEVALTKGARGY